VSLDTSAFYMGGGELGSNLGMENTYVGSPSRDDVNSPQNVPRWLRLLPN
jgi:hypothetical protein